MVIKKTFLPPKHIFGKNILALEIIDGQGAPNKK
jgi:hypothetical protein